MSKAIAITRTTILEAQQRRIEIARSAIVLACGAALILAGQPLPF